MTEINNIARQALEIFTAKEWETYLCIADPKFKNYWKANTTQLQSLAREFLTEKNLKDFEVPDSVLLFRRVDRRGELFREESREIRILFLEWLIEKA